MSSSSRQWRARLGAVGISGVLAAVAVIVPIGSAQAAVSHVWPVCRQGGEGGWTYTTYLDHRPRNGVDINQGSGADDFRRIVVASAAGTLHAKPAPSNVSYGNTLTIKHSDGTYSFYAHLEWRTTLAIGAYIEKGRPIASIGSSGTTSPHLHYEQRNGPNYGTDFKAVIGGNQLTYDVSRKSFTPTVACT